MDTCHQPSAVSKRLLMADCRWLMAFLDKPGHGIRAQKRIDAYLFCRQRNASQGLALGKSSIGTPERCPLNLCRGVSAPTVTGASINEDARSLIENASSLSQDAPAPRPDPRSLRPDPRSFRPDPHSLRADGRSLRENARARPRRTPNWRSPRHTVGINGHSSEIEERTLPLERASLRIER